MVIKRVGFFIVVIFSFFSTQCEDDIVDVDFNTSCDDIVIIDDGAFGSIQTDSFYSMMYL
ncbi:hypothetical protein MHTCC0001_21610 [Flavobacteriaceae bacterium MHTCC 0001]